MGQFEKASISSIVEDATFDFTMGDAEIGIAKLQAALQEQPEAFEAWHALCEIFYSEKRYDEALEAAEKAHALKPDDLFVNTSLSRIWLEKGSKEKAEHFGAQARMASWKDQLQNPDSASSQSDLA
ncbi:tetratricopeptide repeat protein [Pelagicoccus albus]|uniref:Tetratricopeptide repeat protein n=1 Tax=Pelagicoccus albus TaxID=415222 RepID=A0A7X1B8M0_9BACT|nr:tetratricopeptide repeat protein [Pelagicoccus albus]MBC2607577.1 tetratricopeptide repeat protein [Pelagicoccus albus]